MSGLQNFAISEHQRPCEYRYVDDVAHVSPIKRPRSSPEGESARKRAKQPRSGQRKIVPMTIINGKSESVIRVLLDSGASIPCISKAITEILRTKLFQREVPLAVEMGDRHVAEGAGRFYTPELVLRHQQDHFSMVQFEVMETLDDEADAILPFWWLNLHQPGQFFDHDSGRVVFDSDYCKENCTSLAVLGKAANVAAVRLTEQQHLDRIPERFRNYVPLEHAEAAKRLPDHKPWDHSIDLVEGATLPWGPLYAMSGLEKKVLRKWLDQMQAEGKIRPSKSSCSSPLFFVTKEPSMEKAATRDPEYLRPVIDYRAVNARTIKNRYPLPLITELQDALAGARIFTKLDLKTGFNLIRIKQGDEWKTAFRTCYGLFELTVMTFGFTNAPATFQGMINHIFQDMIDQGLLSYIDDLLIYAATQEEHDRILLEVLKRLRESKLAINPSKCVWDVNRLEYLGYIISATGIEMSTEKVQCILDWERPRSLKGVQSFVGFANFYRRFIKNFSRIAKPLTDSTKLDKKHWAWTKLMECAFEALKRAFTEAPVLAYFDPQRPPIVEADSSDYALGATLSQKQDDGRVHPVAFHSRKLIPAEMNYEIHDKELLAIVDSFSRWRHYLEGAQHRIEVFSDHHNLSYFQTAKVLNRRQARWAQQLATFDFVINFRPGAQNAKADILSRREEYRPEKGDENQPITSVLSKKHFADTTQKFVSLEEFCAHQAAPIVELIPPRFASISLVLTKARLCSIPPPKWNEDFLSLVKTAAEKDEAYQEAVGVPGKNDEVIDGVLYRKGRLVIPADDILRLQIMRSEHDTKVAGHMGMDKTVELIRRNMWWSDLENDVSEFVRSCHECQQNKARRHFPFGPLVPIEIQFSPWRLISMDFITDLPLSNGCTSIWVIVDTFTKMAHFIPLKDNAKKGEHLVPIFAREYWRLHGVPTGIISDRDSRFTSKLWTHFLKYVGIKPRMSTAFHPQTDGQTERLNQFIEAYLRAFVNFEMSNWESCLATAEFAYNNARSTSTGMSPFYANYGYHPAAHNPPDEVARNPQSLLMAHWMTRIYNEACATLKEAKARMKRYADRTRTEPPTYKEGQLVMLDARNIKTKRPTKKLDRKLLGPFNIAKVVSPSALQLTLPSRWRIHDTFHVSLIEPYRTGSQAAPDPQEVLDQAGDVYPEEYVVEEIKDSALFGRDVKYLVKWENYPSKKDWTWEPFEHFTDPSELWDFYVKHPRKPKDHRVLAPCLEAEPSGEGDGVTLVSHT